MGVNPKDGGSEWVRVKNGIYSHFFLFFSMYRKRKLELPYFQ